MSTKTLKLVIVCCCMIFKQVTTKMAVMPATLATVRTNADKSSFSELNSVLVEGPQFCSAICMTNSECGAFTILDDIEVQNSKQKKYTCMLYEMYELTENTTPKAEISNEGITYILHRQQKIDENKTSDQVTNKIEKSTSLADNTQSTKDMERRDIETTEKQIDEQADVITEKPTDEITEKPTNQITEMQSGKPTDEITEKQPIESADKSETTAYQDETQLVTNPATHQAEPTMAHSSKTTSHHDESNYPGILEQMAPKKKL